MKKRTLILGMSIFWGVSVLAGCAKTPEESLVKMKGKISEKNYEEAPQEQIFQEETKGEQEQKKQGLRELVKAPESYKSEASDETGRVTLKTDAVVEIPDVSKASAIAVSQHPFDQEMIDRITEAFFPGEKIYSLDSYYRRTKDEIMKEITTLKGYLAEGNLDPYNYGKDEGGNYIYDINLDIESYEEEYKNAPEKRVLEEVKPGFESEDSSYFSGYVKTSDESEYQYYLKRYSSMPMEVRIEKFYKELQDKGIQVTWYSQDLINGADNPSEEEIKKKEVLSLEEAQKIAEEKVALLDIPNMELAEWEYAVAMEENYQEMEKAGEEYRRKLHEAGYVFHFTRNIEGLPITYTDAWGGALEDMDSEMETWGYEVLNIYVGPTGVVKVEFNNLYDIGETKTDCVKLKSFDEIMDIYEKMSLIKSADASEYIKSQEIYTDRITFGYSRIYEPSTDSQTGVLVPVWDFFGGDKTEYIENDTDISVYESYMKYTSHMTINAIDGSVIDRELGY